MWRVYLFIGDTVSWYIPSLEYKIYVCWLKKNHINKLKTVRFKFCSKDLLVPVILGCFQIYNYKKNIWIYICCPPEKQRNLQVLILKHWKDCISLVSMFIARSKTACISKNNGKHHLHSLFTQAFLYSMLSIKKKVDLCIQALTI